MEKVTELMTNLFQNANQELYQILKTLESDTI